MDSFVTAGRRNDGVSIESTNWCCCTTVDLATAASQNDVCKPQQRFHINDLATMTAVKNESN